MKHSPTTNSNDRLRRIKPWGNRCYAILASLVFFTFFGVSAYAANAMTNVLSSTPYWQPKLTDTWQWQLSGKINTSYDVVIYDIDLFDTPATLIGALQVEGRKVVCYFSAGSAEKWRQDYDQFKPTDLGKKMDNWAGEQWLDIRSATVRKIMLSRLTLAAAKGCNGVEPDNVDAYANNSGFELTPEHQLDYNRFLATEAHRRGLSVGLKNNVQQLADLVDDFDFAVNEQCHEFNECDSYNVFLSKDKPVFNAEYAEIYYKNSLAYLALCTEAGMRKIQTLVLPLTLDDGFRLDCSDTPASLD